MFDTSTYVDVKTGRALKRGEPYIGEIRSSNVYSTFLPFRSRPSLKITERSYSATTLIQVQREKGSVTITRRRARPVRTMAQNPGPSGSAAIWMEWVHHLTNYVRIVQHFLWFQASRGGQERVYAKQGFRIWVQNPGINSCFYFSKNAKSPKAEIAKEAGSSKTRDPKDLGLLMSRDCQRHGICKSAGSP